ncbi:MAG: Ig-like domain-containing protein [Proteobacteria bacterium]|nr:Ig-like domain-containing protein [Pseudomonadota bacterium]
MAFMKLAQQIKTIGYMLAAMLLAGSMAACDVQSFDDAASAFNGNSPPAPPPPPPPPPPPGTGFNPVFSEIQSNVFTPSCAGSSCHSGVNPRANLNLEAANSYAMLVGIASDQDGGIERVNPGSPDLSYLIRKLENIGGVGVMPPSGMLAQPVIETIRQWITAGALDDTAVVVDFIQVASLSPAPGAPLTVSPAQIIAGFDADLDASTVNALTFILEASVDGVFDNGDDVQITALNISVGANPRSAIFDINGVLADDTYRVRLLGDGANIIMDTNANVLDGEFIAGFPSGDGTAGGDFVSQFSITTPVAPTFDEIQTTVFTLSCASCHSGANLPAGLDLSAGNSFAMLVGIASSQDPTMQRVNPDDPDLSYLIRKMEGNGVTVMPPSGMLNQTIIDGIRLWIENGAPP